MKDQIRLLLNYNQNENKEVFRILQGLSEEERVADRKAFYKSLHGLVDHDALVAVLYEKAILENFARLKEFKPTELPVPLDFKAINFPDFSELKAAQEKADQEYIEIFEALTEEELNTNITRNTARGPVTSPAWFIILNYINHGIHHRGQIMQIFEEMNIEANFGMLKFQL